MKSIIVAGIIIIVGALVFSFMSKEDQQMVRAISNFEECAAAGYPIMESYPEQCATPDGRTFTRDISNDSNGETNGSIVANGCAVAGCSSQLCVSAEEAADIVTTCEYRAEYACYREASCEPQADGKCGWTPTPQLRQCLANPPVLEVDAEPQPM